MSTWKEKFAMCLVAVLLRVPSVAWIVKHLRLVAVLSVAWKLNLKFSFKSRTRRLTRLWLQAGWGRIYFSNNIEKSKAASIILILKTTGCWSSVPRVYVCSYWQHPRVPPVKRWRKSKGACLYTRWMCCYHMFLRLRHSLLSHHEFHSLLSTMKATLPGVCL